MDFIYRSAAPRYKGCEAKASLASATAQPGFWSALVGTGNRPAYRLQRSASSLAPLVQPWWQVTGAAPQYKAAPAFQPAPSEEPPAASVEAEAELAFREDWQREADEVCAALREIRIW